MDSKPSFFDRKTIFLLVGGLLLGVLLGIIILWSDGFFTSAKKDYAPVVGKPLEEFSLTSTKGEEIRLSDYLGKPVVINFWATWCKPCENEMPLLNQAASQFSEKAIFLGINVGEDNQSVTNYGISKGLSFPLLLDPDEELATKFLISGYPTTFFIDSEGILRAIQIGEMDVDLLTTNLRTIGVSQ